MPVDIACEAICVAAEAGTIVKDTVEPFHMRVKIFDCCTDKNHGDQCSYAYNMPLPLSEVKIAQRHCYRNKAYVNHDFGFSKRNSTCLSHCNSYTLARHCHRATPYFQRYSYSQHKTAHQLHDNLPYLTVAGKPMSATCLYPIKIRIQNL